MFGTRRPASSGPPRLGPFPSGWNQDARAALLQILGMLRASGSRPGAPVPVFPEPVAWLMPWQQDGAEGGTGPCIPAQEGHGHFLVCGGGDWTCWPGAGVTFILWVTLMRLPSPPPMKVWKSFQRPEWPSIHQSVCPINTKITGW